MKTKVSISLIIKRFWIPVLIYFSGIVILLIVIYNEKKYAYLKRIDNKLLKTCELVSNILPKDFHNRATDSLSIGKNEDWQNIVKLTKLAEQMDVSYIYTLVIQNGKAYFTSCSTNPKELRHRITIRYYTPYENASKDLLEIPLKKTVVYETTTGRRGSFRSVFVPSYSSLGNFYIIGADIDLKELEQYLNKEKFFLLTIALILTLLFIPTIIQIIRTAQKITNELNKKIQERTAKLSKELISHKQTTIVLEKTLKEKEELANKAKEALDSKNTIIRTISHELRTPLNVIIGINSLLAQENLTNEQKDYCKTIDNASKQILAIIEASLQVYYSQPDRVTLELSLFNLNNLINQIIQQHSQALRFKKLEITYHIDDRIPNFLVGDETFLRQVLFNILNNAVKFTPKGKIHIEVEFEEIHKEDNKIIILFKIIDTGTGIPLEKQKQITKALYEDDLINQSSSLGLGLTLCKHLAKMLNANLWFKSEENKGTEFYFRVPLSIGTANINPTELPLVPEEYKKEKKEKLNILIAEDNELNSKLALRALEKYGHEISIAKTGKEVIELLKKHTFDVILLDLGMPEMNGFETIAFIHNHPEEVSHKEVPIIALTAHATQDVEKQCIEAGFDHYVVKPINFNDLNMLMINLVNKVD